MAEANECPRCGRPEIDSVIAGCSRRSGKLRSVIDCQEREIRRLKSGLASALAAAPLAPTGGGEMEHLEQGCALLLESVGDRLETEWPRLDAWLEAERARKAGK